MSDPYRDGKKKTVFDSQRPPGARNGPVRVVGARTNNTFSFGYCDSDEVLHFVRTVVAHGDCVSFSETSDGGALCITVLCGDRRLKSYARNGEDVVARMSDMLEALYA